MSASTEHYKNLIEQGLAASQADDTDSALKFFREAGQEAPAAALPHFLAGAELAQAGRMAEAEQEYSAAVLLEPNFAIARFELGTLQFTSGRAANAMISWQPLLALPENDPLRLFVLGYASLAQDAFDDALRYFEQGMAGNKNPALNGNIQQVVTAIHRLQNENKQRDEAGTSSADTSEGNTDTGAHFLLSAYKNDPGRLH